MDGGLAIQCHYSAQPHVDSKHSNLGWGGKQGKVGLTIGIKVSQHAQEGPYWIYCEVRQGLATSSWLLKGKNTSDVLKMYAPFPTYSADEMLFLW